MSDQTIFLEKGQYLAPNFKTCPFDDLLIGTTHYSSHTKTGQWHSHANPMISFVLYGENVEHRKSNALHRRAGAVNFYHAHEPHKNTYYQFPSTHISIEIDANFMKRYGYTEAQIEQAVAYNPDTEFTFLQLLNETRTNDEQSASTVEMLFLAFLERRLQACNPQEIPDWMLRVRELLHDRWNENLSLKELSDQTGIHPVTISKNFTRYFQCTLGEYTRRLKVSHAMKMLNASDAYLTEIAYNCGFSDQSHFTRVFKSTTNFLPKEYLKL